MKHDLYRRFRLKGMEICDSYHFFNSDENKLEVLEEVLREAMKNYPLGEIVTLGIETELDPKLFEPSIRDRFHVFEPENFSQRKKMLSTTVRKFKGLEAQFVVIHDYNLEADGDLVYTGVSRAIEQVAIVLNRDCQIGLINKLNQIQV
jgi:hypothetical protein